MPTTLVKDGKTRIVETLEEFNQAREAGFEIKGDRVELTDATGQPFSAPAEEADFFIETQRAGPTSVGRDLEQQRRQRREEEFGGTAETVRTFGEGGLSVLTGGLSDHLFGEGARKRAQVNPTARTTGEVAGGITSIASLRPGGVGSSVIGKTPAGLATRAAADVGRRTATRLGGGTGARIAGNAVEGAVEGGLFSAGQVVSDLALTDEPLTTESVVGTIGTGTLLGGGIGAAFGSMLEGGQKLLSKRAADANPLAVPDSEHAKTFSKKLGQHVRKKDEDILGSLDSQELKGRLALDDVRAQTREARAAASTADEVSPGGLSQDAENLLENVAEDGLPKKVKPNMRRIAAKNGVEVTDDMKPQDIVDALEARRFEAPAAPATPPPREPTGLGLASGRAQAGARRADELIEPVRQNYTAARKALRGHADLANLSRKGPKSAVNASKAWDDYYKAVQDVDELAGTRHAEELLDVTALAGDDDNLQRALRRLDEVEGEQMAEALEMSYTPETPAGELALKSYTLGRLGVKAEADEVKRLLKETTPKDEGGGGFFGNPLRRAAFAAAWIMHNPGLAMMAHLAASGKVRGLIKKTAGHMMRGVGAARKGSVKAATPFLGKVKFDEPHSDDPKDKVQARMAELDRVVANPESTQKRLDAALAVVRAHNVQVGFDAAEKAMNRLMFLHDKMPTKPDNTFGAASKWRPSAEDVSKWSRYVRAAEDPRTILQDAIDGTLTLEAVETMRTLYPEMLSQLQQEVVEQMAELQTTLPYERRLQLSILVDVPVEPSTAPEKLLAYQSIYEARRANEQKPTQPSGQLDAPVDATKGQQLAER